eukprot:g26617.t1
MRDQPAVVTAAPHQRTDALSLLFSQLWESERREQVAEMIAAETRGELSLAGLLAVEVDDRVVGAVLYLMQPDQCAYVWPPAVSPSAKHTEAVADALLTELKHRVEIEQAWIAQCLVDPESRRERDMLVRNGFFHLADLDYLTRPLSEPLPPTPERAFETIAFEPGKNLDRFADVIERTYIGSLDCPGLDGIRSGSDSISSHSATGVFMPENWTIFRDEGRDVGVLILADHPDQDAWEVVYMGILPQARGRGYGKAMLLRGLHAARESARGSVVLAVDSRNRFARRVYDELGFEPIEVRSVHVMFPTPSQIGAIGLRAVGGGKMQPGTITGTVSRSTMTARDTDDLQQQLRDALGRHLGERNLANWFRDDVSFTIEGDTLTVGLGSPFLLSWMQKQFRREIGDAAQEVLGASATVRFTVDPTMVEQVARRSDNPETAVPSTAESERPAGEPPRKPPATGQRRFADLADFVAGKCNDLAFLAATQAAEGPGTQPTPLFLHGGVGVGKTHLLEGIYRRIRKNCPQLRILYLTAEAFTNYFMQALRERSLPSFRQRFRNVDVLLIDDVDFFESKSATQEEFLHTFQQLESHGRQIILTSDRHPRLLTKLSEELTSRFVSGLVCRLESPDFETRLEIVNRKADKLKANISAAARRDIAQRFQKNVRELEGCLNCLATYHSMTGKRIGRSTAARILSELQRDCIRAIRIRDVETAVCELFGVDADDLKSSKRHKTVSRPRMLAMFLARKLTLAAYTEIGEHFGGRNHSTVISAEKKVREWLDGDEPMTVAARVWPMGEVVAALEQQLQAS